MVPVCIFAKPPLPAEVKTRLIPTLGESGAAELAAAMLHDVWQTVASCPALHPVLATTRAGEFALNIPPADLWLQGHGDLGQRIARIVERALHNAPSVVVIGADSPTLTAAHLQAAVQALQTHDLALGPSHDGGFYLLALRRSHPLLFRGIPWSCSETLAVLQQRAAECRLSCFPLAPLFDVDTPEDLLTLEQHLAANPTVAPATRAWCRRSPLRVLA